MRRRRMLAMVSGAAIAAPLASSGLLGGSAAVAHARPATPEDQRRRRLQSLLDAETAAGMVGVFAHVREGQATFALAAGTADLTTGRPARPHLRHRIGGVTKTFVAATILQLAGERRLDLDRPIGHYLAGVVPGDRGQQVTVRMLLNQTSGIDDYVKVLFASPDAIAATATTTYAPRELVRIALGLPPLGVPGTRWSYANTNYVILGLLIERVTGHPYAAEVTRRVLRPLRLTDTYFPGAERTVRGAHMKAYVPWVDGTLRDFSVFDMSWAGAAGELVSTTPDVNRFFRALLGGRLLRPELLREMKTTVPFDPAVAHLGGYGLGLYWLATPCGRSWGHNGLVIGQTTYSTHAEDGDAAQLTIAENLNSYQDPANPAPHPIDLARAQLQLEVSCGGAPAAPGAASATRGLAAASALATHRQGRVRG